MGSNLNVLRPELCKFKWNTDSTTQICAGNTYIGDSGGPLMIKSSDDSSRWFLVGILSYGSYPFNGIVISTQVKYFYDWITLYVE